MVLTVVGLYWWHSLEDVVVRISVSAHFVNKGEKWLLVLNKAIFVEGITKDMNTFFKSPTTEVVTVLI